MIRSVAAVAASCLVATACASAPQTIKLAPESVSLAGKSLVSVDQDVPGFTPFEPAGAAFGAIGGLMMASAAATFAQQNGIVDPAPIIEESVKTKLASQYSTLSGDTLNLKGAKEGTPYPKRDGVLFVDAKTTYWQYVYFPMDWGRFKVQYNALVQLVDGESSKVLGQHFCVKESHTDSKSAPTKDQLLANRSELLNTLLVQMAQSCAADVNTNVLGAPAS